MSHVYFFIPITILCLIFETPTLAGMAAGWVQIAYAGLLSTGVAYTLQAVGQQHVPASNAAIILSSESLFAALAGALGASDTGEEVAAAANVARSLIAGATHADALPMQFAANLESPAASYDKIGRFDLRNTVRSAGATRLSIASSVYRLMIWNSSERLTRAK